MLTKLTNKQIQTEFENCINPFCPCSITVESTKQFFLHCHYYPAFRISFINELNNISPQFELLPEYVFVKTLLYGNPIFNESDNHEML